jgi:hypothetical protein
MVRMLKELKDDVLKQLNESQKNMDLKNWEYTETTKRTQRGLK